MSLDIHNDTITKLKAVAWAICGVVLLAGATALVYSVAQQRGGITLEAPYEYTINQSLNNTVEYVDSEYYPNGPEPNNSAYVTDLTRSFTTNFYYSYDASKDLDLTYSYSALASVRGTYGITGSKEDVSNVWSRQFQLIEPVKRTTSGKGLTINETVNVPFKRYKDIMDDFRTSLALPVNSQMQVTFTVKVQGTVRGEQFVDTRVSTISAPLNVQIYQLLAEYDKTDSKQVPESSSSEEDRWPLIEREYIAAAILTILAVICFVIALRRGEYKTAYQRELEKIYRYHDGIIIRTSKPVKLSASKSVVSVSSFGDILNLEEETKSPIIASPAGDTATRFMIVDGDEVYMYVLGKEPADTVSGEELGDIDEMVVKPSAAVTKKRPPGRSNKKRIQ